MKTAFLLGRPLTITPLKSYLIPIVVLSLVFIGILPSYALTQSECNALANLSPTELGYTVVTCDFPFDVTVNMGQRLSWSETLPWEGKYHHTITSKTGLFDMTDMGSTNMLPSAWGGIGVYEYYDKLNPTLTGKITVQNPPNVGIIFQNVQVSFSGSQMLVSGSIVNSNSFPVKNLYVYWHVTDSSGNYLTSWQRYGNDGQMYSAQIPAQSTSTFSETVCCLPSSGASTATPYIVQAFREDGTKLIFTNTQPTQPTDGSFTLPCSMQEKGDGVSSSSCNGFYEGGIAKAKVGIQYNSGLFPIKNYKAVGFFIDKNGNQGQNIQVTIDQIKPGESQTMTFANTVPGFVSQFKMQMLGGDLVTESKSNPVQLPTKVEVLIAKGSASNTSCADKCYNPSQVSVAIGGTVTWKNMDSAAHTVTSGKDATSDGIFDSGMVMVGKTFSYKLDKAGTFDYYCMVHPWMTGSVVVGSGVSSDTQSGTNAQTPDSTPTVNQHTIQFMIKSSTITVSLDKNPPKYAAGDIVTFSGTGATGKSPQIILTIFDPNQNKIGELTFAAKSKGSFQTIWQIPNDAKSGTYAIQVTQASTIPKSSFDTEACPDCGSTDTNNKALKSKEQMDIDRQKAELAKEKQKLDLEKQKLELEKQKDEMEKQKKELQRQKESLSKDKTQSQKTDSSKSIKTKEQLAKEKRIKSKKQKN